MGDLVWVRIFSPKPLVIACENRCCSSLIAVECGNFSYFIAIFLKSHVMKVSCRALHHERKIGTVKGNFVKIQDLR